MTAYKYVGRHIDDLADGRLLVPGATVEIDDEAVAHPHNVQRLQEGLLIPVQTAPAVDATDEARDLAEQHSIALVDVKGTGKDGRIVKSDVETHIEKKEGND